MDALFREKEQLNRIINAPHLKGKYFNLQYLYSLSNENSDFLKEMIDVFFEQINEFTSSINKAIEETNWHTIHKSSHKFKSSLRVMGIENLTVHFEAVHKFAKEQIRIEEIKNLVDDIIHYCKKCMNELKDFKNNF